MKSADEVVVTVTDHALERYRERADPKADRAAMLAHLARAVPMTEMEIRKMLVASGVVFPTGRDKRSGFLAQADGVIFVCAPDRQTPESLCVITVYRNPAWDGGG